MRWPRGKYNGQRIVGFELKVKVDVLHWRLWGPSGFTKTFALGPLRVWAYLNYEDRP